MRKRLTIFILLTLLTVLVACEGEETEELSSSSAFPETPTVVPLPPNASTAARIRARGYLRIGVRYDDAPFGSVDDEGRLVGFDIDLAHEFAFRWMGNADAVKFVQVTDGSINDRIKNDQVDFIIGALSPHQGAAQYMDFSAPYYYDGLSLLVRAGSSLTDTVPINGPRDLDGVVVAVVEEADTEAPLSRAAAPAVPQVIYYPDYFSAVAGLQNGVIQAVVGPRRTLMRLAAGAADEAGGMGVTPRFTRDPYVIGVPQGEDALRDLVNVTLMNMINDGTYHGFFQTWFPDQALPELQVWSGTSRLDLGGLSDTLGASPETVGTIEARGYLVAGLLDDQLPFSDLDANGVARGFEAELVRAMVGRWLGSVTAVQFVRHSEASGIAALQTGQIDLLVGGLPHTLPRDDDMDFSLTYYQESLTQRPVAIGLRQGDGAFRDLVNLTLQELAAEGRLAALYDDWFGTDPVFPMQIWPGSPYRSLKLRLAPQAPATETP